MSRLADAAYELIKTSSPEGITTKSLWDGMRTNYPELTEVTDTRKTPRITLMRDLNHDRHNRFVTGSGQVKISMTDWKPAKERGEDYFRPRAKKAKVAAPVAEAVDSAA